MYVLLAEHDFDYYGSEKDVVCVSRDKNKIENKKKELEEIQQRCVAEYNKKYEAHRLSLDEAINKTKEFARQNQQYIKCPWGTGVWDSLNDGYVKEFTINEIIYNIRSPLSPVFEWGQKVFDLESLPDYNSEVLPCPAQEFEEKLYSIEEAEEI